MNHKLLFLPITLSALIFAGCSGDSSPFITGGGGSGNPVSDKNFELVFDPVQPDVIDDDGFHSNVEVVVTALAGDKFNSATSGATVHFVTQWGVLDKNSCQIANGSCSVTWRSNSDFGFLPGDYFNTFTAYTVGEESYRDLNGSGNYDDADNVYIRDLDEPYLDINHDGVYTANIDEIIDIDFSGDHTLGDDLFNGADCIHSTLCSATPSIMISEISYINLDQRGSATLTVTISSPTPLSRIAIGSSVTFTASAIDPEDGEIFGQDNPLVGNNITWSSSLDGNIGALSNTFAITSLSAGDHTVTVTAIDSLGNTATDTVDFTITDDSPVVVITAPTAGDNIPNTTNTNFTATITDTEDGTITTGITWSSDVDGVLTGTTNSITSNELVTPGAHVITASVTDSDGNTTTNTVSVTVL
ncbi:MAG: PKD domain-containing protein [Gammaproteobacteria bacterium]|nr:PKD domain-containing protein [Gammaproteobacteria bacterium]